MSEYLGNFVFHPVGHGLFYSGVIRNLVGKNQFTFVYDCGGYKKDFVTSAINDLPETIDLLIISHFHEDHINGVSDLKEKHEIKTVVLPYLNDESKLLYIADLPENKDKAALTEFILKPESFFGENTQVFFIKEGEPESKPNREDKPRKDERNETLNQEGFDFSWTNYDKKESNIIVGNADYESPIWAFHFFMPKRNEAKFKDLQKFFDENGINPNNAMNNETLPSINKDKWGMIKDKIVELEIRNNIPNLVCAHGPTKNVSERMVFYDDNFHVFGRRFGYCRKHDCLSHDYPYCFCKGNIGFQFLTGDAEIDDQKAFFNKYSVDLAKSILFQVPHHGSEKNWRDWFAECQPFCNCWPVTHNVNHRFKGRGNFPSAVFSDMAPYSVTEREETKFKIDMSFWV